MSENLLLWLLITPLVISLLAFAARLLGRRAHLVLEGLHVIGITLVLVFALGVVQAVLVHQNVQALNQWLYADHLGAIFVLIIGILGFLNGLYSIGYMRHDLRTGEVDLNKLSTYYGFYHLFLFTMLMAVTSNNLILMWVAVEATTLGSAFLVGLYGHKSSLEAVWKYVLICTVGVAFALYGTILVYSNAFNVLHSAESAMLWTEVIKSGSLLDPMIMNLAFVFVLIGFGTKAGLFPMHAWLPDAHSEAPSPISALLSGVLLKCALFVIIRYYLITAQSTGTALPQLLFLVFGVLSIAVAALFIFAQRDIKRLLAYSSVENIGLIVVGLGLGGVGIFAALLHTINHSIVKSLMFCTSGNVLIKYKTRDLGAIKGLLKVAPVSTFLLMGGALALGGVPPFNIFVSELWTMAAGVERGSVWLMAAVLLFLVIVFAAFLRLISGSVFGPAPAGAVKGDVHWFTLLPIGLLLVLMILLGVYMPAPLYELLKGATQIVSLGN
ncbi:NADH-quinone oxidoreductase subunit M [Thermoflexales bacterium]|nr:NADH-quinone oxidoreductase subunit M [Thermoflexales bacterium]